MKKLLLLTSFLAVASHAIQLKTIMTGFNKPVHFAVAPGESNRFYVVEQIGKIRVVENGVFQSKPFLDITKKVISGGEMGLLSVAFHPDYAKNSRYFVYYTSEPGNEPRHIRISEVNAQTGVETILLKITHDKFTNHNGGQLAFDSKGFLYAGVGDGGSAGDPFKAGQDLNTLLGKILRLDVSKPGIYSIPNDNPFASGGGKGEIYAYGLRNAWRFSFDSQGRLWTADVGQNELEEIDIVEKGKNYGWNIMEGTECFPKGALCDKTKYELPIFEYNRDEGASITGGYVYRGKELPQLVGKYIYADYLSGNVWALTYDAAKKKATTQLLTNMQGISSFGEDHNGEIYATLHFDNAIAKLVK